MNHFSFQTAAERYAAARPYFHPKAIKLLLEQTGKPRFHHALDVATGTGMGAKALLEVSQKVSACDLSVEMLAHAKQHLPEVEFLESSAEELPFLDEQFDLVTVFLAFHWFDQERFLKEARRVLNTDGVMMICNHYFLAQLEGNPEFRIWANGFYANYKRPARAPSGFNEQKTDLKYLGKHDFTDSFSMSAEELALYISSQSNIIAKVEQGTERLEDVLKTIEDGVRPLLSEARGNFLFRGTIWLLRK
jgi:ubiquinone/menaquinone biosynthesis C-methylase UbiE